MKSILASLMLLVAFAIIGCLNSNDKALHQIKILANQLDSANSGYQEIDWEHWTQLNDSIHNQTLQISNHTDLALKLDPSFVTYFGPYSTAGKILSRIFRKSKNQLQEELTFSKIQLENLSKDIKAELINDSDSITFYIEQEHRAIQELIFNISSLESTLLEQQKAFEATDSSVGALVLKIKSIKPSFGKSNDDIYYDENQEQD